MAICDRCAEEYKDDEVYPSKYFSLWLCIPCEKRYEQDLFNFKVAWLSKSYRQMSNEKKITKPTG